MTETTERTTKERITETCAAIRADIEADVNFHEGMEFNGRNVSTMYGNLAACVDALAAMVALLAEAVSS